jgi:hypothetical protein
VSSAATAGVVFVSVFSAALAGMALRRVLPQEHLTDDAKDVIKLAMGLVATLSALVLGLLISSAKTAFDVQDNQVKQAAANLVVLDRTLAHYGPDTKSVRDGLRSVVVHRLEVTWPENGIASRLDTPETTPVLEGVEEGIRALSPKTDEQRALQAHALEVGAEVVRGRWLLMGEAGSAVQPPLLVILAFWLAALFVGFGLFAPRNGTVITVLLIAAVAVAGSFFLILEMNQPFTGLLKISPAPLRYALAHMGQ